MATEIKAEPITSFGTTVLRGITWKTYLGLRLNERNYRVRMDYLDGTLTLMSPQLVHDNSGWWLAAVVSNVTEALNIPIMGIATTTLRRKRPGPRKGTGKEPDYGFYVGAYEMRMRNKQDLDLEVDPPPDLVIEVDNTGDSRKALKLYARLGVPEVWRYTVATRALWFGRLAGEGYEGVDRSACLPVLTPSLILHALDRVGEMGETAWKPWLREWARNLPGPPAAG